MSSACVCHTDEWCFYCEMYSPLEREHSKLKGEVQRVIEELNQLKEIALQNQKEYSDEWSFKHWGIECGLEEAISKLKELIPSEVSDSRHTPEHE